MLRVVMHRESGPVVDLVALAVTTHGFPPRVAADIADVRSGFFGVHAASIARLAFSISLYFMVGSGPAARRLTPPDAWGLRPCIVCTGLRPWRSVRILGV